MIGFTCSTFDLLHPGHVVFLTECKQQSAKLGIPFWIGLQTDIRDRPNKNRPVQTVYERFVQLDGLRLSDKIIPYESELDLANLLATIGQHVRFLGDDYEGMTFTGHAMYNNLHNVLGISDAINSGESVAVFIPRKHAWSTTELRTRVRDAELDKELETEAWK